MQLVFYNFRVIVFVWDSLAAPIILEADLCDKFVQDTGPGDKVVELADGIAFRVLRNHRWVQQMIHQKKMGTPYGHETDAKRSHYLIRSSATINIPAQSQV